MKIWQWNKGETDWLYEEIFKDDLYTSQVIKLEPGYTVFDCGANIGMFALHAHHKTNGNVTVHSFEPMPKIHDVCAANAKRFGGPNQSLKTYQVLSGEAACRCVTRCNSSACVSYCAAWAVQRACNRHL